MKRQDSGRRSFNGACGVLTWLLLSACEPAALTETRFTGEQSSAPEAPSSPITPSAPEVPSAPTEPSEPEVPSAPTEPSEPTVPSVPGSPPPTTGKPPPESTGRSWYVSAKGLDVGKGTRESPLRSISRAVTLAKPGDVIRVLPGVYAENLLLDSKGASAAAITLRGEGTTRPTIVPGDRKRSTVIFVRGRWNLENLHIDVGGARMFAVAFVSGSNQSSLSGSDLHGGTTGAGVLVEGARHLTIQNNTIHHFIKPADDSHGVVVVGPSRDVTIRGNDIHHNSGDSVQCQAGNVPATVLLIEGNTMHDEGENAVDIKQCHDVIVRNNQAYGFPNTAVRPPGSSAGEAVVIHEAARGIVIQGNTFSKAGRGVSVLGGNAIPEDIWIERNTFQEIRGFPVGNGQGIRISGGRNVQVVGNTIESAASYGLMLAADGEVVTGLIVKSNRVRKASQPLLLRLGRDISRPGMIMSDNQYDLGGILKADGVQGKLAGVHTVFRGDFPGEQLTLSTPQKLGVWRQVLGLDQGSGLLP